MRRVLLLAVGVVLPVLLWTLLPAPSRARTPNARLSDVQRRLETAEARLSRGRGRERLLTTDIVAFSRRIRILEARSASYSRRLVAAQRQLDNRQAVLDATLASLRTQRSRRRRLQVRLRVVKRVLARRLVELYEADRPDVLTVVLNSAGFADLRERADFLGRIAAADRTILVTVRDAQTAATTLARALARLEERQRRLAEAVRSRRDGIARARTGVQRTRDSLAGVRATKRRALASVRGSRHEIEREVSALTSQQAKIQRTLRRAQTTNAATLPSVAAAPVRGSGGGPMIWPVNGPITSPFCGRRSYEACHPGIDIGVPDGTPIRAAAAGKVVLLQPEAASGGYGNYTCVQHTSTLSSCYAHQSRFGTTPGATVRQGEVIGFVGNTGHSFGPHLHWEVRRNGAITNPSGYV